MLKGCKVPCCIISKIITNAKQYCIKTFDRAVNFNILCVEEEKFNR